MTEEEQGDNFYGRFHFISAEEFERIVKIEEAKENLNKVLVALNGQLLEHSKSGTIREVKQLLAVVRRYSKLISGEVFDEFTVLISGLIEALLSTQDHIRGHFMARIEEWHAFKPKFILHLPELRQIVFSRDL